MEVLEQSVGEQKKNNIMVHYYRLSVPADWVALGALVNLQLCHRSPYRVSEQQLSVSIIANETIAISYYKWSTLKIIRMKISFGEGYSAEKCSVLLTMTFRKHLVFLFHLLVVSFEMASFDVAGKIDFRQGQNILFY